MSTRNLGRNLERLEECRLAGIAPGRAGGDDDVGGRDRTDLGRRGTDIALEYRAHFAQIAIREHESDIAATAFLQLCQGGIRMLLAVLADALAHHGVFTHEDFRPAAQFDTRFLYLLGADIVNFHNEAFRVGCHEFLHSGEVLGLAFGG